MSVAREKKMKKEKLIQLKYKTHNEEGKQRL